MPDNATSIEPNLSQKAEPLWGIVAEVRQLGYCRFAEWDLEREGGALLDEAVSEGAFQGKEHAEFRLWVRRAKRERPDDWEPFVWRAALQCLIPDLADDASSPIRNQARPSERSADNYIIWRTCAPIADAIEAEAQTLINKARDELTESLKVRKRVQDPKQEDTQRVLDQPGKAAAAKLKLALPIIPLLASYEMELDTESAVVQVWRKVKGLFRRTTG